MNESSEPPSNPLTPRPGLEGLDLRRLMAEGFGLDGEAPDDGNVPVIPGYELLRLLGAGGMGRVYLARQISLNRLVAAKVLGSGASLASQWLDRLEREAHAMARISHPNIVSVYDFVRLDEGGAAIIMEWVESGNLREKWLAKGRPVRDRRVIHTLVRQIASSLAAAHRAGIVHRDLKPENVLVSLDGTVKVTDFGLALPLGPESQRLTLTGTTMGTLGYMAPEQIEGAPVDERADLYSLGVILYEMLTGIRPQGHFDPPRQIRRDTPPRLEKLCLEALRTRPRNRVPSAEEFIRKLETSEKSPVPVTTLVFAGLIVLFSGVGAFSFFGMGKSENTVFVENSPLVSPPPKESEPETVTVPLGEPSAPPSAEPVPGPPDPAPVPPSPVIATPAETPPRAKPLVTEPSVDTSFPVSSRPPGLPAGFKLPESHWSVVRIHPLRGEWVEDSGGYRSDGSISLLQVLTALPPRGADVRLAFTRLEGTYSIALFFRNARGAASAEVSAWETNLAGIQCLNGNDLRNLADVSTFAIENGRRYEMLVEIRPDRVRLSMDGRLLQEAAIEGRDLSVTYPWAWDSLETTGTWLAIGSYESPTLFHELEIRPVK